MDTHRTITIPGTTATIYLLALGAFAVGCGGTPADVTVDETTVQSALSGQRPVAFPLLNSSGYNSLAIDQSGPGTIYTVSGGIFDYGVAAQTTPSLVYLPDGGIEVGFQCSYAGYFCVWSNSGNGVTGASGIMYGYSSPSIVWLQNNQLGFGLDGENGHLWAGTGGLTSGHDTGGWMSGGSPSVAQTPNGNLAVAIRGSNGHLWLGPTPLTGIDTNGGMSQHSSPSIAAQPGSNNVAFAIDGSNNHLWVGNSGPYSGFDTQQPMAYESSPSVAVAPSGTVFVAYASVTDQLCLYTFTGNPGSNVCFYNQYVYEPSSPQLTIQITPDGQYQIAYTGINGDLWINLNGQSQDQLVATPTH